MNRANFSMLIQIAVQKHVEVLDIKECICSS